MQRRSALTVLLVGAGLGLLAAVPARAQSWPDRPVKLVLSQPAGSGPDNVARLLADRLAKQWGQAVVIENKPGGQNSIGAQAAARAPADGSTFYFATTAALVTNAYLFKHLPYEPQKDFVPVGFVARSPFAVVVRADSPLKTLDDLVARSKAQPGGLAVGTEGPLTFGGMIARLVNHRTQAEANLVSYVSTGVSAQNLIGGHVEAIVADVASTAALVKQGRLRYVAVTSAKRVPGFDEVPTLSERLPGLEMVGWFAVVAPTGTPQAAVQRFNKDLNALLADPEVVQHLATMGPIADSMTPDETGAFIKAEHARWSAFTKEINVLPE